MDQRKKQPRHKSRVHTTHLGDTPEVPDSSEQETLNFRALQDLFLGPLLSRIEDVTDFPNTQQ